MDKLKVELKMIPPIGEEQVIPLDACIVGGFIGDGSNCPMGAYMGDLDIGKTTIAMSHVMRSFFKICQEQGLNLQQAKSLLDLCAERALETEEKNEESENVDLDTHMLKMRWDRSK